MTSHKLRQHFAIHSMSIEQSQFKRSGEPRTAATCLHNANAVHWCKEPARISQDRFAHWLAQSRHAAAESNAMNVAHLLASRFTFFCSERELSAVSRARRLTLRSSGRVPAGRFRPSFHSEPYAFCLHARLNSNVSAQKRPQFKRSSSPCKVGESMLNRSEEHTSELQSLEASYSRSTTSSINAWHTADAECG